MDLLMKSGSTVLLLVILTVLPQPSGALENTVHSTSTRQTLLWKELIFKGSKFLISTTVKIKLSSADLLSEDPSPQIGTDISDCLVTDDSNRMMTVQSSYQGVGVSLNQHEEKIWFSDTTLRAGLRVRVSSGDSPWIKRYCWEEKGVRREKISPADMSQDISFPPEWTKHTASFHAFPEGVECDTISDPALVLYILSTREPGSLSEPFEICVFGKKQTHRLIIGQEQSSSLKVSYTGSSSSQEFMVEDKIHPAVFSITAETFADDEKAPEQFSFFGLHKNITVSVDREKGLPVRITGANSSFGDLVLDLRGYSN